MNEKINCYLFILTEEYIKYFAWKYEWRIDFRPPFCKLCEMLNNSEEPVSMIDLKEVAESSGCISGSDLPWMLQRYQLFCSSNFIKIDVVAKGSRNCRESVAKVSRICRETDAKLSRKGRETVGKLLRNCRDTM